MAYKLCKDCGQPMLPQGVKKRPNEYDHAQGCPSAPAPSPASDTPKPLFPYWQCPNNESHPLEFHPRWQSRTMRCTVCGVAPIMAGKPAASPASEQDEMERRASAFVSDKTRFVSQTMHGEHKVVEWMAAFATQEVAAERKRVLDVLRELVDAVKAIREDVFSNSGRVTGRTQTSAQSALEKAEAALLAADKEKGNE